MRLLGSAVMQRGECPYEKTGLRRGHVKRDHARIQREDIPQKAKQEASDIVSPAHILTSDLEPPNCKEICFGN